MNQVRYVYDVQFELIGTDGLIFEEEFEFGDFKLKSDKEKKIIGMTVIELNSEDHKLAREVAISKIQKELIPILILSSPNAGYAISNVSINLRPIVKKEEGAIFIQLADSITLSDELHIHCIITKENIETYVKKFESYWDKIERLSEEGRRDFLRAVKFWNRGANDADKIDKFINFFIAFEILGKSLVGDKEGWINEVCKKCELKNSYDGYPLSQIRASLLHAANKRLTKEKAEELVEKYVDFFGGDVVKLMKEYLKIKSGDNS